MHPTDLVENLDASTTRRRVLATGVKLAYAAPLVAATMKLSAHGVVAASEPGTRSFEGCSAGFWRMSTHLVLWCPAYSTSTTLQSVFGSGGSTTLLTALQAMGGGVTALYRQAAAALLNACSADVDYAFSVAQVILKVQAAIAAGNAAVNAQTAEFNTNNMLHITDFCPD